MNTFNYQIWEIDNFSESLKKDLPFKLGISWYIKENDNFINQDYFWCAENINDDYIIELIKEAWEKLEKFKIIKKALKSDTNLSEIEKKFLLQVLNSSWFELVRFKNSVYLEAEKAWFKISEKDRKKYVKRLSSIERVLFWDRVSDRPPEIEEILNKLQSLYNRNNDRLTEGEKDLFSSFFKDFNRDLSIQHSINLEGKEIKDNQKKEWKNKTKNNPILKKDIPVEKVKEIFDLVLELYWIEWWNSEVWNFLTFSANKNKKLLTIPESRETITVETLLGLIDHEIWVHAIRSYNKDKTLKKDYLHYLEAEEWFARLSKSLFYDDLENVNVEVSIHLISSFIAENYDWKKTYELLKIYYKLSWKKWAKVEQIEQKAQDRMLRVKKYFSLNEKWSIWKDVDYYRWEKKIQKHLLKENDIEWFIKKFYFSKLSLEDLEIVENFRELLDYKENQLIYPIWIWKILFKKLSWEKVFLKDLKEKDLRFKAIDNLSFWVKRKIIEILNLIKPKKKKI